MFGKRVDGVQQADVGVGEAELRLQHVGEGADRVVDVVVAEHRQADQDQHGPAERPGGSRTRVLRGGEGFVHAERSASLTRGGVRGRRKRRAPVASNTAFAMAAPMGTMAGSPPPCGARASFLHQDRLDLREPREARHLVGVEVLVLDLPAAELELLGEHVAEAHGDAALDLHGRPVGVDDDPHVLGADDALDADLPAGAVDLHLHRQDRVGPGVDAAGDAPAAPAGSGTRRPAERPGRLLAARAACARRSCCGGGTPRDRPSPRRP